MIEQIDKDWLCSGICSRIHGDFILDNIIETNLDFKLIDWRQNFAGVLEYGDLYYDLAKLNHNLILNHEVLESNGFLIETTEQEITCDVLCRKKMIDCQEKFHRFIQDNGFDLKKVRILTSIIWINMAPLHEYPLNKFLFYFGKFNLHRELKNAQ